MGEFKHAENCTIVANASDTECDCLGYQMQRVWRTASQSKQNGYFIWDVQEVIGTPFDEKHFIMCRDGSWIMVYCQHTWVLETAGKLLHEIFDRLQILEIIEDPEYYPTSWHCHNCGSEFATEGEMLADNCTTSAFTD